MLNIFYGAAGTGKSTAVMDEIKRNTGYGNHSLVVIPNQFTFEYERSLYDHLGIKLYNSGLVTVLSPERLVYDIFDSISAPELPAADVTVKTAVMYMTVKKIADDKKEGFLYFKKTSGAGFVNTCTAMITELRHSGITPEILAHIADMAMKEKKAFAEKLSDISRIYTAYENALEGSGLRDSANDTLSAAELAYSKGYFRGLDIYIDEFKSFTGDQYALIKAMVSDADSVTVCLATPDMHDRNIFLSVNRTMSVLSSICEEECHEKAEYRHFDSPLRYRSEALAHLSSQLGALRPKRYDNADDIYVISAADIYTECAYICSCIKRLVADEGYSYKDIAVLSKVMDSDINILSEYMELYGIPYYSDKKQSAAHKSLICLINSALSCAAGRISTETVMNMAKTYLILDEDETSALENYAYKWDIEGSMWLRDFPDEDMDILRHRLLDPLKVFLSGRQISEQVRGFLDSTGVYEILSGDREYLSESENSERHTENSWLREQTEGILASLDEVCRLYPLGISDYAEIFAMASEKTQLAAPPSSLDEVKCQQSDLARLSSTKIVFVMHAQDGVFPGVPSESRTFSENERDFFKDAQHDLSGDLRLLTSEERFNAYKTMCSPSDRLYISYSESDSGEPSLFIRKLGQIFRDEKGAPAYRTVDLKSMSEDELFRELSLTMPSAYAFATEHRLSDDMMYTVSEVLSEDISYKKRFDALERARMNTVPFHTISADTADRLFGSVLRVSPTSAEKYAVCPFRFFCSNGLGIRKPEKQKLDNAKWGLIVHECLEKLVSPHGNEDAYQSKKRFVNLSDADMKKEIDGYISDYIERNFEEAFRSKDLDTYLKRLSTQTFTFASHMQKEMAVSGFVPKAFETKIIHNAKEPHTICFNGTVDRIDDFILPDGTRYIRVVDYKTGKKEFSLDDVANGLNIQMLLYMFEATELPEFEGSKYAGVLYALVHAPESIPDREPDDSMVENILNDTLRMDGILLRDENNAVIYAMEPGIRTAYENNVKYEGRFIPIKVKITKTGTTIDEKHTADDEMFARIKDMIYTQLGDMCRDIYDGLIPASPLKSSDSRFETCDQCDFADLCISRTVVERKRRTFEKEDNDG